MRTTLSSNSRTKGQLTTRRIASALIPVVLTLALMTLETTTAIAQVASSIMQPADGMTSTSPLSARSTRPTGIPLGSTEIATPGISRPVPSQGSGGGNCDSVDGLQSSGTPFDGGGVSASTSLSCADGNLIASPLPPSSLIGRAGIPLGATELGSAGVSPAAPASTSTTTNPSSP